MTICTLGIRAKGASNRRHGYRDPARSGLPRVFDRFLSGGQAAFARLGGSGWWLSIARTIFVAHGGDITCTSDRRRLDVRHLAARTDARPLAMFADVTLK